MGAQCDRLIVKVLSLVDDAHAFHDAIPSAERELNTMVPGSVAMSERDPAPAQYSRSLCSKCGNEMIVRRFSYGQ